MLGRAPETGSGAWPELSLSFAVVWSNAAAAITAGAASCALPPEIVFQTDYCCKLEAERFNLSKSDSDKETPCTCRSQSNARVKDAVFTDSFRWHLNVVPLLLHQDPILVQTQSTGPATVQNFANKPQFYILNACLLI